MSQKNKQFDKPGFPEKGIPREDIFNMMKDLKQSDAQWKKGKVFGYVYYPGDDIRSLTREAYNLFMDENTLNPMVFPSLKLMESELVSMAADLLHGNSEVCGTITSGGTESQILSLKTAREWAKEHKPDVERPEVIIPVSAHPSLVKGVHYLGLKAVMLPLREDYRADVVALKKAINKNTVMIVGSAPSFPQGVIDPIAEMGAIAEREGLLMHVDSCLGGFMLPFLRDMDYDIPEFDFNVPGVTSMSADFHKFAYTAKGCSVILYRNKELRKKQYYAYTSWPGGIYASSGFAGTRSGGHMAAAWATLHYLGKEGYRQLAAKTMETSERIIRGIKGIESLEIMGDPAMCVFSFRSKDHNVYNIADKLRQKGWLPDILQLPPAIHMTLNAVHNNIADEFISDLNWAVEEAAKPSFKKFSNTVQNSLIKTIQKITPASFFDKLQKKAGAFMPQEEGNTASLYGMIDTIRDNGNLDQLVTDYLDNLHR